MKKSDAPLQSEQLFENPFQIQDLMIFDNNTLHTMLRQGAFGLTVESLAHSLHNAPGPLLERIEHNLSLQQRVSFLQELRHPLTRKEVEHAQREVLDRLFWELTYWKTPELYEELTEGEHLPPGIFEHLQPDLQEKIVLDIGAGSGRASFECIRYGAKQVYAVEPSPGLLHILEQKRIQSPEGPQIIPKTGRFDDLPLENDSVDTALSCSAFTTEPEQGGEPGLAEMQRVTRSGGKIVLIWPRSKDRDWLHSHGFHHVSLPLYSEMRVRFRSLKSALRCTQRFYAHNKAVARYLLATRKPEIPFSVLGINPLNDYYWLEVTKTDKY